MLRPYDVKVYLTLNRREALKDADFVTTQFRVGLLMPELKMNVFHCLMVC